MRKRKHLSENNSCGNAAPTYPSLEQWAVHQEHLQAACSNQPPFRLQESTSSAQSDSEPLPLPLTLKSRSSSRGACVTVCRRPLPTPLTAAA